MEGGEASQNDPSGPAGTPAVSQTQLDEPTPIHTYLQSCDLDMNGKAGGRAVSTITDINANSNSASMVSDLSPDAQPHTRSSRTPRKGATFGKRSNSMRRNPKAEVAKQGWLSKQASSGVKQWNKRWFVLTDRCLFYYKDEKEETVLGSLPLLSFRIGGVQPSDNIARKFSFKAEHAGTRTYYFSADSPEEQEEWIAAMSEASQVNAQRTTSETSTPAAEVNNSMVTKVPDTHAQQQTAHTHIRNEADNNDLPPNTAHPEVNGIDAIETPPPSTPHSDQEVRMSDERKGGGGGVGGGGGGGGGDRERGDPGTRHAPHPNHQPNGWGNYGLPLHSNGPPPGSHGNSRPLPQGHLEGGGQLRDPREQPENMVLRRGFVPRTAPERVAQRKSSMTQLQQWVNQRRGTVAQDDVNSSSHYYTVNRGVSADYYSVYPGGPTYVEEYPLYPPGVRPDSICSVSAVGGYDRRWTPEEKRRSLRDGPPPSLYGPPMPRDPWGPQYYGSGGPMDAAQTSMRRLSIQPRSRSVPRSPSLSSGGPYSPGPHNFASPAHSPSTRFDRMPGRIREDVIYADPSIYGLRRSLSSPKYDYPGDRRLLNQGLYHYNYPASPSIHGKMVPPFHDVYSRDLHPTLKLNEIETSKLLGRLCEQSRILKDQESVVHRLRMDKDSLEGALVATHQEMELYRGQPLAMDKLQLKKETLQNQLINIRGELSQASSALTTTRMEFETLEDEANAIHGDLWEQLNAGGQSELVHRHIQKEFWRVQDVLEGLHKGNLSRGTDTAKHRVTSGASGSFSTNSPASPLSSVSLTSPLSPFSPVLGSQASPTKQMVPEVSTGCTPPGPDSSTATTNLEPGTTSATHIGSSVAANPVEVHRRSCHRTRPKSCIVGLRLEADPRTDPKPRFRPRSYREPDPGLHSTGSCPISHSSPDAQANQTAPVDVLVTHQHTVPQPSRSHRESSERLQPAEEEEDQSPGPRTNPSTNPSINTAKARAREHTSLPQVQNHASKIKQSKTNRHADTNRTHLDTLTLHRLTQPLGQQVMIGYRKDIYPDPHPRSISESHHNGLRYMSYNRHCSVPESQPLLLQKSHQSTQLAFSYSSDHRTPSMQPQMQFRAASPETRHCSQLASQARPRACTNARPLTYPNNQLDLSDDSIDPVFYLEPQTHSPSKPLGKVFMQTHL